MNVQPVAADIGNAAAFLCSDEASMITGVALNVDGGRCI
jgi:3-oxoacyl-[acyl-carrier protein] reductase